MFYFFLYLNSPSFTFENVIKNSIYFCRTCGTAPLSYVRGNKIFHTKMQRISDSKSQTQYLVINEQIKFSIVQLVMTESAAQLGYALARIFGSSNTCGIFFSSCQIRGGSRIFFLLGCGRDLFENHWFRVFQKNLEFSVYSAKIIILLLLQFLLKHHERYAYHEYVIGQIHKFASVDRLREHQGKSGLKHKNWWEI